MRRVFKVTGDAAAGIELTEESAKLAGDRNNFFYADESGSYVVGPLSILTEPQNIRMAGMFVMPTAYEMTLPSTAVTPVPQLIADPPIEGFANLAQSVAQFISELI